MSSPAPQVTIAIAAYNRAHLIGLTIDSLLKQTEQDFEILISDDASEDGTREICERYASRDARIRYFRNEQRLGLARNCSRVLGMASGEFVVLAGDDDLYEPDFLSSLLQVIRSDDSIALAACRVDVIDQQGSFVRDVDQAYFQSPSRSQFRSAWRCLWKGYGNLMTGVYRRRHLARTRLFQSVYRDFWDSVDLVFLFDVALSGDIVWIDRVLLHKRAGGVSGQGINRSFFATLVTFAMTRVAYLRRLIRPDVGPGVAVALAGSILVRTIPALWSARYFLGYSLLTDVDRTGRLRRRLRNVLPHSLVARIANDPSPGVANRKTR